MNRMDAIGVSLMLEGKADRVGLMPVTLLLQPVGEGVVAQRIVRVRRDSCNSRVEIRVIDSCHDS